MTAQNPIVLVQFVGRAAYNKRIVSHLNDYRVYYVVQVGLHKFQIGDYYATAPNNRRGH